MAFALRPAWAGGAARRTALRSATPDQRRAGRSRGQRHLGDHADDATHWSTRSMGARNGLSYASVRRIWHAFGLQPHRVETFKLSTDPQFIEKVRDIVGLYLNPPDKALVLCVD